MFTKIVLHVVRNQKVDYAKNDAKVRGEDVRIVMRGFIWVVPHFGTSFAKCMHIT